jgi:ATP-dependent helicase/nuclease subunit A
MNVHQMIRRLIGENMYELSDIDFKKSFRTLPVILGLVDSFFKQDSIFQLSNLNQDIEHISGRADGAVGRIEIMPIVSAKDEKFKSDSTDDGTEQKATEQAKEFFINQIADKIQTILKMRDDVKPDDIMILVKKRNPFAAPMIDALQKRNIPVSGADRISLPDYPPVMDLLAMMRFCIDNTDDYSLACALKSPFFELSDDEIFKLCRGNTRLDENNKLRGTIFEEIKITRPELFNKLQNIISHAINLAPYSFMMWLLDENRIGNFSVRENMLRRMGTQINDPLEEFLTLSLAFERTQSGGIIEFIDWFIKGDSVVKRDMNIADGVKVMTVYGAKGLEAKIVFLIDTASLKDNSERSHPLRLPNGLWVWKAADMRKVAALARFYEQQEIQKINEYYRLCYVAMTRPKNELYIYGYTQYNDAAKESWYTNLRAVFGGADDNSNTIVIE